MSIPFSGEDRTMSRRKQGVDPFSSEEDRAMNRRKQGVDTSVERIEL